MIEYHDLLNKLEGEIDCVQELYPDTTIIVKTPTETASARLGDAVVYRGEDGRSLVIDCE